MSTTDFNSPVLANWRSAAGASWEQYVDHQFVRGLGDGSLPRSVFIAYLIQDYLFLIHYSRVWSMAVVKSETVEQMRAAAATVNALINQEIQLHINVCKREGIPEAALMQAGEENENLAYTRYVMDVGLNGDLLDLLAALSPCVFGYAEIGARLADCHDTSALYREWIDTYHCEEYDSLCTSVAQLVEQVALSRLGEIPQSSPRWAGLCQRFETATRLEASFWSMAFRLGKLD